MSELKLASPLLDGFMVGNAMSDHDGIRCYPAMREGSAIRIHNCMKAFLKRIIRFRN